MLVHLIGHSHITCNFGIKSYLLATGYNVTLLNNYKKRRKHSVFENLFSKTKKTTRQARLRHKPHKTINYSLGVRIRFCENIRINKSILLRSLEFYRLWFTVEFIATLLNENQLN